MTKITKHRCPNNNDNCPCDRNIYEPKPWGKLEIKYKKSGELLQIPCYIISHDTLGYYTSKVVKVADIDLDRP